MSNLWTPTRRLVAIGEPAMTDFRASSDAEYVAALSDAVHSMAPMIGVDVNSGGIVIPPIQTQIAALTTVLEASSGLPIGELGSMAGNISRLSSATNPSEVVQAVTGIINDVTDVVADIAQVVGVAASAIQVIPIVGQVLGAVLGIVSMIFDMEAQKKKAEADAKRVCAGEADARCSTFNSNWGHGAIAGSSYADEFRRLAYLYQRGLKSYPPTTATLMLTLCGGAAGDFGITEERYQDVVRNGYVRASGLRRINSALPRGAKKIPPLGYGRPWSYTTRERMWKLIKAIIAAARDPREEIGLPSDQGRVAGPILMDIVRNNYYTEIRAGYEPLHLYKDLMWEGLRWTDERCQYAAAVTAGPGRRKAKYVTEGCSERLALGMAKAFEQRVQGFNRLLQGNPDFFDRETNSWRTLALPSQRPQITRAGTRFVAMKLRATGALAINDRTASKLFDSLRLIQDQSVMSDRDKALAATSAVVLGGASFFFARRLARRRE